MDIRECINYLLTTAQHQVFQLLSSKLAPYGITPGQHGVLNCLWRKEAVNPKEMAQILGLETSTISGWWTPMTAAACRWSSPPWVPRWKSRYCRSSRS